VTPDEERAFDFVVGLRDAYLGYHAAKEREAYFAAALYLGASIAFITHPEKPTLLLVGMIAATITTVLFVAFQLYSRWLARRIVTAASNLAVRWLTTPPATLEYAPTRINGTCWPAALVQGMQAQRLGIDGLISVAIPTLLLVWGAAVICPALHGRVPMHLEVWLNAFGLVLGVVAAFLLAIYRLPPESLVGDAGEQKLQFTTPATFESRREAAHNRFMARLGAGLLGLAFLLQLIALLLPLCC
jgi:hypothetical protein